MNSTNTQTLDNFGAISGEIVIPSDLNGGLSIGVKHPSYSYSLANKYLTVDTFDKPQYEIVIDLDKDIYQNGDEGVATITAKQYDGTVVRDQEIRFYASTSYLWYTESEEYGVCDQLNKSFYDYERRLNYYETQTVELDNEGTAEVKFKVNENVVNHVAELNVSASLGDVYGSQSVGVANRLLHPSKYYLNTYMDKTYVEVGNEAYLNIEVLDKNCQPVSGIEGNYSIDKITYTEDYQEQITPFQNDLFVTDTFGKAEIPTKFDESAYFRITTNTPSYKDQVISKTGVWIFDKNSSSSSYNIQQNSIAVEFDKDEYNVGDTAVATVFHPGFSDDPWFTMNRNAIQENRIVRLGSYQTQISFEIKEQYVPTAKMEIGLFSNNKYYQSEVTVNVNEEYKEVNIEITPDKEDYKPGDTDTLTLKTTNLGNAVSSNVTLTVVDKSVLDLERNNYY